MGPQTSSTQQGYPQWQPPVHSNNIDAGWTQLMTPPVYPNRFDSPLAPQPQAANHLMSSDVQGHRLPSTSKEVSLSGLRSQAGVGFYNPNQQSPSQLYGPAQASYPQRFGYS